MGSQILLVEYQMRYIINISLLTLVVSTVTGPFVQNVFWPKEFLFLGDHLERTQMTGQFRYPFENVNYEISALVYQQEYMQTEDKINAVNYQHDPSTFRPSQKCYVEPSFVSLSRIAQTQNSINPIRAYLFNNDRVFVLSDNAISVMTLSTDHPSENAQFNLAGMVSNLESEFALNADESKFITTGNYTYICDKDTLYLIDLNQDGPSIKMELIKVQGYTPLSDYGEMIRLVTVNDFSFLMLSNEGVFKYTFYGPKQCAPERLMNESQQQRHNFVDIAYVNHHVVLLEDTQGIYVYNTVNMSQIIKYALPYEGRFIKMQAIGSTIQVIGEYQQNRYVVELLLHTNTDNQLAVVANRFYNQITGIRDVDFFDNKAIFIGEDEIMVIIHSANRNLLLNLPKKQNRQLYLAYGILEFDVIESVSNTRDAFLVCITQYNLILIILKQHPPTLVCDLDGETQVLKLVVQFNCSNCGAFNWKQWRSSSAGSDSYCRILESVSLQVTVPLTARVSKILMVSIALICLLGILVMCGLACKLKTIKFRVFRNIIDEIQNRRRAIATAQSI